MIRAIPVKHAYHCFITKDIRQYLEDEQAKENNMRLSKEIYDSETIYDKRRRWNRSFAEKKKADGFVHIHMRVRPEVRTAIAVLKKSYGLKSAEQVFEKMISDALAAEGKSLSDITVTGTNRIHADNGNCATVDEIYHELFDGINLEQIIEHYYNILNRRNVLA